MFHSQYTHTHTYSFAMDVDVDDYDGDDDGDGDDGSYVDYYFLHYCMLYRACLCLCMLEWKFIKKEARKKKLLLLLVSPHKNKHECGVMQKTQKL